MESMVWRDCDRHGLARIGRSGPGIEMVVI